MSQFRTTFDIPTASFEIGYQTPILSMGSCFATHIARKLKDHLFDIHSNPNGIVFNPISIAENLRNLIAEKIHDQSELVHHNGMYHSWIHHHTYSGINASAMVDRLNQDAKVATRHLKKSKIILITFGTAFAYRHIETNRIVANCHKIPNHQFEKVRLSESQIVEAWKNMLSDLFQVLPDANVIMTVSPVRHLKDGLVANQRSKATLLLTVDQLAQAFSNVHYFPSYEIMMDDLRDYRFYNDDMLHPNKLAIDYIWEAFVQSHMSNDTQAIMKEVDNLQKLKGHRVQHPESASAISFQKSVEVKWKGY